jgi:hypothetical protein
MRDEKSVDGGSAMEGHQGGGGARRVGLTFEAIAKDW